MTDSEIGPLKKYFFLFAAWCFDFCLIVFAYLVAISFVPRLVGPLCPYALSNTAAAATIYWYLPIAISLIVSTLLLIIAPASPGRYLADLTGQSAGPIKVLKRLPLFLAVPVLLIYTCGSLFYTFVVFENNSKDKLDSPDDWAISDAVGLDETYNTWHGITNPGNSRGKRYDYQTTARLSKGHTLGNNDVKQDTEVAPQSDAGFYSQKALSGRVLANKLNQYSFINIEDILITGLEYKQRQLNYLEVANKTLQKELQELEEEPITNDNLQERSELLCKLGKAPAASKLLSANLPMVERDFNLTKEQFYAQKDMANYKEALNTCNKLIAQAPLLADWYVSAATISYSLGNYKESLAYLEKAEKTLPFTLGEALGTTASVHLLKAKCLRLTGNHQAAEKEDELAQALSKKKMASFASKVLDIPLQKNKIRKLEKILAHFNPAQLQGQVIEPHVYALEAKALVEHFDNKKPSAKEITEVLAKSLNQQLDQLYQIKCKYDYAAAVAVKPLPPQKRELSKLSAELAKAW